MAAIRNRGEHLDGPSRPETRVIISKNEVRAIWAFVEETAEAGTWIEIDDQHVYSLRDME